MQPGDTQRAAQRTQAGHALGLAVIVVLLLSVGASLLALDLTARLRRDRAEAEGIMMRSLADAAVARALAQLEHTGNPETPTLELGPGRISSRGERRGQRWLVQASAELRGRVGTVEIEVVRAGGTLQVVRWSRVPAVQGATE